MMRSASILLLIGLTACVSNMTAPPDRGDGWTYIGNDPQGTENILMASVTPVPQDGSLTTTFRFQYTSPHTVSGRNGNSLSFLETRDRVRVNCAAQTLELLRQDYYDVNEHRIPDQVANTKPVDKTIIPGGVNDLMYQAVCGRSVGWSYVATSADHTQKVYVMGQASTQTGSIHPTAWFKTVFDGPHSLIAAPSMQRIHYSSKISTLKFDCPLYEARLLHEVYYDADGHKVFDIQPPAGKYDTPPVTGGSVRAEMYQAACGTSTPLHYLGTNRQRTQIIYTVGSPSGGPQNTVQARFRVYYSKPGRLTAGPDIHSVSYVSRSLLLDADCSTITYKIIHEKYLNNAGQPVFDIHPAPNDAPVVSVAPGSLSEMLWQSACRGSH